MNVVESYRGYDIMTDGTYFYVEMNRHYWRYLNIQDAKTDIDIWLDY